MPGPVVGLQCDREQDRHSHVSVTRMTGTGTIFILLWHSPTVLYTEYSVSPPNVGGLTHPSVEGC